MNRYLCEKAQKLIPYTPGEQPKDKRYVKLNTNENPYPPSEKVLSVMKQCIDGDLKLYPDPDSSDLLEKAAEYYHVKKENVFAGNGSDEILSLAFMAFYQEKEVLFPKISYSFYPVYCNLYNVKSTLVPMINLNVDSNKFFNRNKGIVIANPNAPTGEYLSLDVIEKMAETNEGQVVLIDEAYIDFGGESAIRLIDRYENLLIVQTFSKSRSLAGLRLGLAFGSKKLIEGLNTVKNSFNSYPIDRITQRAAYVSFEEEEYFKQVCHRIMKTREEVTAKLERLDFVVLPSKANFIFAGCSIISGKELYTALKERGVLVRYFNLPDISNYVRITIGTDDEMNKLVNAIENILGY
ncbi:MAG: histidinol-phosphate transaminase [Clostridia bacterium]|nr:histidinol-phosphate transaminase [Clostridia bacterium]